MRPATVLDGKRPKMEVFYRKYIDSVKYLPAQLHKNKRPATPKDAGRFVAIRNGLEGLSFFRNAERKHLLAHLTEVDQTPIKQNPDLQTFNAQSPADL